MTHPIAGVPPPLPDPSGLLDGADARAGAGRRRTAAVRCCCSPAPAPARRKRSPTASPTCSRRGRARPWEILAVTFSVRAAGELRLRLADLLGETRRARGDRRDVSLGVRAAAARARRRVRAHRALHDLRPGRHAPRGRLAAVGRRARCRSSAHSADHGQPASAEVLAEISRAKNLLLTPESYERSAAHPAGPLIAAVWRESEEELRRSNAFEFDDLLAFAVTAAGRAPAPADLASSALALDPRRRVPGHEPRPGDAGGPARRPGREPVRGRR